MIAKSEEQKAKDNRRYISEFGSARVVGRTEYTPEERAANKKKFREHLVKVGVVNSMDDFED